MRSLGGAERRFAEQAEPVRRDPAPSRLAYRMDRLWLTPMFRLAVRVGLPFVLAVSLVGGYLADDARRAGIAKSLADLRESVETRPEFMVKLMAIDGASAPVATAIRKMLPVALPASSFRLDLEALRAEIEQVDAVASAELHIRKGGILQVTVRERQPAILWRTEAGLEMLDATGHRVATLLNRAARPDLPVIAGEGADARVGEALALLDAAEPIRDRIRGLVRVGERRWDIVLDRDQRILLPETKAIEAVQRVIALDQAEDMLGRDLTIVDLRNQNRPTIRIAADANAELTSLETGVTGQ
ncbi:cell division protein FtsQ/DivIB [Defluviimonas aestuarii]|uniref:cell division protein FtsQ/DivIB n=1 Tax=Albidovulum aestuarii TaxID=1130726 RepID=UPI00249A7C9A|nr:cell division protein FtsQ/DivIB [Defluviimonas aestuarii]MDI3335454.1 cell division protein FtsQ/DivIB [Defluviimonas aestuarii]